MKKIIQFIIFTLIGLILNIHQISADEKIKIGLIVPLSGEYKEIGDSILKATRLAINKIDDNKIKIIPKDTRADAEITLKVSEELQFGMVGINSGILSTEVAPFGGVKESGIGREGAIEGIDEYMEIKYLCFGNIM